MFKTAMEEITKANKKKGGKAKAKEAAPAPKITEKKIKKERVVAVKEKLNRAERRKVIKKASRKENRAKLMAGKKVAEEPMHD